MGLQRWRTSVLLLIMWLVWRLHWHASLLRGKWIMQSAKFHLNVKGPLSPTHPTTFGFISHGNSGGLAFIKHVCTKWMCKSYVLKFVLEMCIPLCSHGAQPLLCDLSDQSEWGNAAWALSVCDCHGASEARRTCKTAKTLSLVWEKYIALICPPHLGEKDQNAKQIRNLADYQYQLTPWLLTSSGA